MPYRSPENTSSALKKCFKLSCQKIRAVAIAVVESKVFRPVMTAHLGFKMFFHVVPNMHPIYLSAPLNLESSRIRFWLQWIKMILCSNLYQSRGSKTERYLEYYSSFVEKVLLFAWYVLQILSIDIFDSRVCKYNASKKSFALKHSFQPVLSWKESRLKPPAGCWSFRLKN